MKRNSELFRRIFGTLLFLALFGAYIWFISNEPRSERDTVKIEFTDYGFRIDDDSELHYDGNLTGYGFKVGHDVDINNGLGVEIVRTTGNTCYAEWDRIRKYDDNDVLLETSILGLHPNIFYIPKKYDIQRFDD